MKVFFRMKCGVLGQRVNFPRGRRLIRVAIIAIAFVTVLSNLTLWSKLDEGDGRESPAERPVDLDVAAPAQLWQHGVQAALNKSVPLNALSTPAKNVLKKKFGSEIEGLPLKDMLLQIASQRLKCLKEAAEQPEALTLPLRCEKAKVPDRMSRAAKFERFCPENVKIHQPDYVTLGHIKPNIQLAIGMATVSRPDESYLVMTLGDLFNKATGPEFHQTAIIVFLADLGDDKLTLSKKQQVKDQLMESFPAQIAAGNLVVIEAPSAFYPPMHNLKRNFNDATQRVYWRAKQCVDFSFIFGFAYNISQYYLHLEDDVITKQGYITSIKNSIRDFNDRFYELEFSHLGFIAKLFRSSDLADLGAFHLYYYEEMPVDMLQPYFLRLVAPAYPKAVPHYPSLFQHKGKKSSLKGKKQPEQDKLFDSKRIFTYRKNVHASAVSNIPFTSPHRAHEPLEPAGFFWSKVAPKPKDYYLIWMKEPLVVEYLLVATGNHLHPNDTAVGAKIEYSFALQERTRKTVKCSEPFRSLASFDDPIFARNLTNLGPIQCIRINFDKKMENWLLISEIIVAASNDNVILRDPPESAERHFRLAPYIRSKYEQYMKDNSKRKTKR